MLVNSLETCQTTDWIRDLLPHRGPVGDLVLEHLSKVAGLSQISVTAQMAQRSTT